MHRGELPRFVWWFSRPEFIFYIGPWPDNPLSDMPDYDRHKIEVDNLLDPEHPAFNALGQTPENTFSGPMFSLYAVVFLGGWEGTTYPCFCIYTLRAAVAEGKSLYGLMCPEAEESEGWREG